MVQLFPTSSLDPTCGVLNMLAACTGMRYKIMMLGWLLVVNDEK